MRGRSIAGAGATPTVAGIAREQAGNGGAERRHQNAGAQRAHFDLDPVVLDDRVGEQLVGRLLEQRLGLLAVAALDLDVEHLALAHACDAVDAERFQRPFDRLALRIENAGFQGDGDAGLHDAFISAALRCSVDIGANRLARNRYRAESPTKVDTQILRAKRLNAQGRRPIAPAAARGRRRGRSRRRAAAPPRTPPACSRPPECRGASSSGLRHAERAQAAAGDQQALGRRRLAADLGAERDDVVLALLARLAEAEQAEALERQHLEALRLEEALQPIVHLVRIGGGDRDAPGAEAAAARRPPPGSWC